MSEPQSTALVVIDVQMAMAHDDAAGADRSCRQAEDNIAALLARARGGALRYSTFTTTAPTPRTRSTPTRPVQPSSPWQPRHRTSLW